MGAPNRRRPHWTALGRLISSEANTDFQHRLKTYGLGTPCRSPLDTALLLWGFGFLTVWGGRMKTKALFYG